MNLTTAEHIETLLSLAGSGIKIHGPTGKLWVPGLPELSPDLHHLVNSNRGGLLKLAQSRLTSQDLLEQLGVEARYITDTAEARHLVEGLVALLEPIGLERLRESRDPGSRA